LIAFLQFTYEHIVNEFVHTVNKFINPVVCF